MIHELRLPDGYDASAQQTIGLMAAQLEDQTAQLKKLVAGMEVSQLEWQPHPGFNTGGMLLAHIAVAETFWMAVAPDETPFKPEGDQVIHQILGIHGDDDGLPLAADGRHPQTLAGKELSDYFQLLDATRAATHKRLKSWSDADLALLYTYDDHQFSNGWTLYHTLEHLIGHFGQIRQLRHQMIAEGVLTPPA